MVKRGAGLLGTSESIRTAVEKALGSPGSTTGATPLGKGYSGEAWLVQSQSGPMLARIAVRDKDGSRLANAAKATELALAGGVRAARFLYVDLHCELLEGHPFSIAEFIEGPDGEEAVEGLDQNQRRDFFAEWGATVARLHAMTTDSFAGNVLQGETQSSWEEVVMGKVRWILPNYTDQATALRELAETVCARLLELAQEISPCVTPTLVHDDLYLPNTIAIDGHFAALLDFEYARFWDPVYDFVKLELFSFGKYPESREAFFAGYTGVSPLPERFEERLTLSMGLELVNSIPFFLKWNDLEVAEFYRSRLIAWVDGGGG